MLFTWCWSQDGFSGFAGSMELVRLLRNFLGHRFDTYAETSVSVWMFMFTESPIGLVGINLRQRCQKKHGLYFHDFPLQ